MIPESITINITASAVAWYGAVVSTLAVAATLWSLWRDRARIEVLGRVGYRFAGAAPYRPDTDYILITVVNHGRRPRTFNAVGLTIRTPEKSQPILSGDCARGPKELTEGKSDIGAVEQGTLMVDDIEEVWAYDQTGKKHSGSVRRN